MKLLLCCTKAKSYLRDYRDKTIYNRFVISPSDRPFTSDDTQPILNGKIVVECDYEVEKIENNVNGFGDYKLPYFETDTLTGKEIEERSCLSYGELKGRLQNGGNGFYGYSGYVIHIKNLHIFDEPRGLSDCIKIKKGMEYMCTGLFNPEDEGKLYNFLKRVPQNMEKVWFAKEDTIMPYYIISVTPEEMCRIGNKEQDVLVRKEVLKGAIKAWIKN